MSSFRPRRTSLLLALLTFGAVALGVTAFSSAASATTPPELDIQSNCIGAHGQLIVEVRNNSTTSQTITVTSVPNLVNDVVTLNAGDLSGPYTLDNVPDDSYQLTATSSDATSGPSSSPVTVACAADESNAAATLDATRSCSTGDITGSVDVSGVRASAGNGAVAYHGELDVWYNNTIVGHATLIGGSGDIPITANLDVTQTLFVVSLESPASGNDDFNFNGIFTLPVCVPHTPASSGGSSSGSGSSTSSHAGSGATSSADPGSAVSTATRSAITTLAQTGARGLGIEFTLAAALLLLGGVALLIGRRTPRQH